MLIRVFGISLYAISTVVAVFMGGLAIGSWLAGRMISRRRISLKAYAWIEAVIGLSAVAASFGMKYLPSLYASIASSSYGTGSFSFAGLRFFFALAVLLLPTALMGATLPALGQYVSRNNKNPGENLALLYGVNTLGAVTGVLFTGFVSLAIWGESGSIAVGVFINFLVAAIAAGIGRRESPSMVPVVNPIAAGMEQPVFFFAIAAMMGFCALSLEVLWSRLAIFLVGSSVYSFCAVLSIYLLGIGAGSLVATRFVGSIKRPLFVLGLAQTIVAGTGLASLYVFWKLGLYFSGAEFLYSPLRSAGDLLTFFGVAAAILFPSTFFMGVSFPVIGRLVAGGRTFANSVGTLYAWNTVGAVAGSLLTGYVLVPAIGTQAAFCLIVFLSFLTGSALLLRNQAGNVRAWAGVALAAFVFLLAIPSKSNIVLNILEERLSGYLGTFRVFFHREDPGGILTGVEIPQGNILLINGIIISGNGTPGHVMAHLPLLMHPNPASAAVICFGVGNTFRAAVDHVARVDAVELMPGVVNSFGDFYSGSARYISSPGAKVYIEDGRQHLLMTKERYDLIVVDASPPIFSAGTVNLYTTDFLRICRNRLSPGGIMCLWVPTPCFESDFWQIASGFAETYPQIFVWGKKGMAGVLLMGSDADLSAAFLSVGERMKTRNLGEATPWLTKSFIEQATFITDGEARALAKAYPSVTDDAPLTEFPLWKFIQGRKFWPSNGFLSESDRQAFPEI